ncbi:hypothetical protein Y032_0022g634 [Ancylostoma ceylanicum]|nr:hypothetical protein Y032_0022g634 [Ancylostoma ceylanicum]
MSGMPSDQLEVERDGTARKEGLDGALRLDATLRLPRANALSHCYSLFVILYTLSITSSRWKTCLDGASDGFLSLHINEVVFVKALIVEMSNQPLLVLAHDPR